MRGVVIACIVVLLSQGCAKPPATQGEKDNAQAAFNAWSTCVIGNTFDCAEMYREPKMCADLSIAKCKAEKLLFVNAQAKVMATRRAAELTGEMMEKDFRERMPLEAQRLIIDLDRKAAAPDPIPLEIR